MSFNYSPKIVTNGLVLCLDAANTKSYVSGSTIWTDLSRSGNTGTLTNGPTFSSANGGTIVFDGTNDYAVTSQNSNISGDIQATISTWIYPLSVTGNLATTLIGNSDGTLTGMGICIGINGAGSLSVEFWNGNGMRTTSGVLQTSKWYNIVATKTPGAINTTTNLYVNGQQQSFSVVSTNTPNVTNYTISIGAIKGTVSTQFYFSGNIAQTQIYNRALSATEIKQNYNATKGRYGL
jgi:hypothetical protein